MKTIFPTIVGSVLCWSAAAAADPYPACEDAYNYGYNMAQFYISAIYNKAKCTRALASRYEDNVFDIVPAYWAEEAATTTPEKAGCMLQGSYTAWMDTMYDEYFVDCAGAKGFEAIQRKLLGVVGGPLLAEFYFVAPEYFTPDVVAAVFAYDLSTWPLVGTYVDCSAQIDVDTIGVPGKLVGALKHAVCQ